MLGIRQLLQIPHRTWKLTLQDFIGMKGSRVWGERYEQRKRDALHAAWKRGTTAGVKKFPKLSVLPFAAPQNIQVKYYGNAQRALTNLVGREVADDELGAAVAALDDTRIEVFEREGRIMTLAHHHWLQEEQKRFL